MESLAARLAAEAADPNERARFAKEVQMIFDEAPRRLAAYFDENAAFHEAIMRLADNRQFRELSMRLHLPLIMAQVGDALTGEVLRTSVREHRAIAHAILEQDPAAAAAAMRAHLERAAAFALARSGGEAGRAEQGLRSGAGARARSHAPPERASHSSRGLRIADGDCCARDRDREPASCRTGSSSPRRSRTACAAPGSEEERHCCKRTMPNIVSGR